MTRCPCGSSESYEQCCGRFLSGKAQPETAEQLMRSRYTAYARQNANYLVATTHPSRRERNELKSIKKSFRGILWRRLEILDASPGADGDDEGTVEFKAYCEGGGQQATVHEISRFIRENGRWFYVDGDLKTSPG